MAKILIWSAWLGFLILLAATVILVKLNWSDKLAGPLFSILLGGTVTVFIAVFSLLRPTSLEETFVASIVFDIDERAPAIITTGDLNHPRVLAQNELAMIGQNVPPEERPKDDDQAFRFCGEILQYRLLTAMRDIQGGGWQIAQAGGRVDARIRAPARLSRTEQYPGESLLAAASGNRFARTDGAAFYWKKLGFKLPPNTRISVLHAPSSPTTGVEKHSIVFEKPLYYRIELIVEPIGGTGVGSLPPGFQVTTKQQGRSRTFSYKVTMRSFFERVTAGSRETEEYKAWAQWMASRLQDTLGG